MTSTERREARYQRRKAARLARKQARCDALGPVEEVFSYRKMFRWGKKCCNGVDWKQSTQNFDAHLFSGTARRRRGVLLGKHRFRRCSHFILRERGKIRPIDAPHISDRQIHKTLCKEVLVPLYTPCLIYDNYASREGMGLHFAYRRLKEMLHWHFRRYGRQGGIISIDLKKFFPYAKRALIYQRHRELILNPALRSIADMVIDTAPSTAPGRGMPLGVEPSQQEMMALPSAVDHWIKCQLGVHCAGHYADDYFVICPDLDQLRRIGNAIVRKFEAMGNTGEPEEMQTDPADQALPLLQGQVHLDRDRPGNRQRLPGRCKAGPAEAQAIPPRVAGRQAHSGGSSPVHDQPAGLLPQLQ